MRDIVGADTQEVGDLVGAGFVGDRRHLHLREPHQVVDRLSLLVGEHRPFHRSSRHRLLGDAVFDDPLVVLQANRCKYSRSNDADDGHDLEPFPCHRLRRKQGQELVYGLDPVGAFEFEAARDSRPLPARDGLDLVRHQLLFKRLLGGRSLERVHAGEQHVSDAGERVNIVARVRLFLVPHLERCIGGRQAAQALARIERRLLGLRHIRDAHRPRNTEVQHFHGAVVADKNVRRLDIGMHDAFLVPVLQRPTQAIDDRPCLLER